MKELTNESDEDPSNQSVLAIVKAKEGNTLALLPMSILKMILKKMTQ